MAYLMDDRDHEQPIGRTCDRE